MKIRTAVLVVTLLACTGTPRPVPPVQPPPTSSPAPSPPNRPPHETAAGVLDDVEQLSVALGGTGADACATRRDGSVVCWGNGSFYRALASNDQWKHGQVAPPPVVVAGLPPIAEVAAGRYHQCARARDGSVWCWGGNEYGGNGVTPTMKDVDPPVRVALQGQPLLAHQIVSGAVFSCALLRDRSVACWGGGMPSMRAQRMALGGTVRQLAAGIDAVCAVLESGVVTCWGGNHHGAVGEAARTNGLSPVRVALPEGAAWVEVGYAQSCAHGESGKTYCWGGLEGPPPPPGAPGTEPALVWRFPDSASPVHVPALDHVRELAFLRYALVAIDHHDRVLHMGQPLTGDRVPALFSDPSPPAVPIDLGGVVQLSGGDDHVCGRGVDRGNRTGEVLCAGRGNLGELGDGLRHDSAGPVKVIAPIAKRP